MVGAVAAWVSASLVLPAGATVAQPVANEAQTPNPWRLPSGAARLPR